MVGSYTNVWHRERLSDVYEMMPCPKNSLSVHHSRRGRALSRYVGALAHVTWICGLFLEQKLHLRLGVFMSKKPWNFECHGKGSNSIMGLQPELRILWLFARGGQRPSVATGTLTHELHQIRHPEIPTPGFQQKTRKPCPHCIYRSLLKIECSLPPTGSYDNVSSSFSWGRRMKASGCLGHEDVAFAFDNLNM